MSKLDETMQFRFIPENVQTAHDILQQVFEALKEKGYDPISQIVGYLISGDPTYITSHKGARVLIRRLERDELMEEVVRYYLEANFGE